MQEIFVSAGEVSGDRHAAMLVRRIKGIVGDVTFWGIGGRSLQEEGVRIFYDTVSISSMGLLEPLKKLAVYLHLLKDIKGKIRAARPSLLILVDFTAFNMKLAAFASKEGIPAISWFSPSAWVWGAYRAKKMAGWGTVIAAVFEMEYQAYARAGAAVYFTGHPIKEIITEQLAESNVIEQEKAIGIEGEDRENIEDRGNHPSEALIIGILPGSRKSEIKKLLPLFIRTAEIISSKHPEAAFILPLASDTLRSLVEQLLTASKTMLPIKIIDGDSIKTMKRAYLILTASGTATLEAACAGTPFIAAYKLDLLSLLFIKLFVKAKYMSLPNLILGEKAFPEFLQREAREELISEVVLSMINDGAYLGLLKEKLVKAVDRLGGENALDKAARLVVSLIGKADFLESGRPPDEQNIHTLAGTE